MTHVCEGVNVCESTLLCSDATPPPIRQQNRGIWRLESRVEPQVGSACVTSGTRAEMSTSSDLFYPECICITFVKDQPVDQTFYRRVSVRFPSASCLR